MVRAYDIMTRAVATATPTTPVSQVARLMRDLNIGDVLVVEDGKLRGIVTDRDLATQVLTNGANAQAPIEPYMTKEVVTGTPDWSVEQIADVMGKNQIRRLPIVEGDMVVGIVSLGDVAVHTPKQETVAQSLKNISQVTRARFQGASPLTKILAIAIPVGLATAAVIFSNTKSGQEVRRQLQNSDLPYKARAALTDTFNALQDPKTRQAALEALESTGIPQRARGLMNSGVRTAQDFHAQERAMEFAEYAQDRAQQFPDQIATLTNGSKPKRFGFM
jgi:CBS domain-containing protein